MEAIERKIYLIEEKPRRKIGFEAREARAQYSAAISIERTGKK